MNGGEATNRSWQAASDDGLRSPADLHAVGAVKQFFALSPDVSLAWAVVRGRPNGTGRNNRSEVYGTDVFLKYRPIAWGRSRTRASRAEGRFWRQRQVPATCTRTCRATRWGRGSSLAGGGSAGGGSTARPRETSRERWGWIPSIPSGRPIGTGTTAEVSFWPSHFSRLRAQSAADVLGWREGAPDLSAFLQFEVLTGAHGSHPF